jgi:hypothetical protein
MHRPCRFSPGLAQRIRARAMAALSFAAAEAGARRLSYLTFLISSPVAHSGPRSAICRPGNPR